MYKSARLRSLPLSVSGILMGTGLAYQHYHFRAEVFMLAMVTAVFLQVLSDYANDYGDAQKGTDNQQRLGPKRAIQSGEMTLFQMKKVIAVTALITLILIVSLIWVALGKENILHSLLFLGLGTGAIAGAIKYTIGKSAYGYRGLGDVFVLVFFGWVSVIGSYFLYTQQFSWKIFLPATAIGLLSVGVLNLNNMRDEANDRVMGKNTIPVRIGGDLARYYHYLLIIIPMVLMMLYTIISFQFGLKNIYLLSFVPLVFHLKFIKNNKTPKAYDSQLKVVALSTFLLSFLYMIGQMFF